MRKRIFSFLTVLLMALCLISPVFAGHARAAQLNYVTDLAGILSADEVSALEARAENIAARYNCGLYIIILDEYSKYSNGSGIYDYACGVYGSYDLGIGDEHTGMLLLMSMADRDYAMAAYGDNAHYAFTDYGKDWISEEFCRYFAGNNWYGGFGAFLDCSETALAAAEKGEPIDIVYSDDGYGYERSQSNNSGAIFMIVFIPGLIALIVCLSMKGKMKSAIQKTDANSYITPNGVSLLVRQDIFTHTTQSRVRKETSSPTRSGGGGGTHISSSGFSGKSGKF